MGLKLTADVVMSRFGVRGPFKAIRFSVPKRQMHTAGVSNDADAGFFSATIVSKELYGADMVKLRLKVGSKEFKYLAGTTFRLGSQSLSEYLFSIYIFQVSTAISLLRLSYFYFVIITTNPKPSLLRLRADGPSYCFHL